MALDRLPAAREATADSNECRGALGTLAIKSAGAGAGVLPARIVHCNRASATMADSPAANLASD